MSSIDIINIQDFKIVKKIGEGVSSQVFLVENVTTNKRYAAKVAKSNLGQTKENEIFLNELKSYSKIDNPAILKFHGYSRRNFQKEPFPTLILDYMPNGSLDNFLEKVQESYFPAEYINTSKYIIILGIVIGMKYLHSKGIVHRDLKPMNILLDENFNPRICDFGVSFVSNQNLTETEIDDPQGTPIYLPPEVFLDDSYSYKVDIYSFSLIMYEIIAKKSIKEFITQNKLFTNYKIYKAISRGIRPDLSLIENQDIRNLISRCWDSDPSKRPDFSEILDELLNEKYKKIFDVDEKVISDYLRFFDQDLFNKDLYPSLDIDKAIEENNIDAILNHAFKLYKRNLSISNLKEAARFFKIAADKGDNYGRLFYGIILKDGNVIERDIDEAVKYIKMAVDDGYIPAISVYGEMLFYGFGVQINIKEGIKYIKFAADNGSILSMYDYALILMDGNGVPSNMEESMRYFKMAADEGFPPSIYCYGRFLLLRDENDGNDIKEACKYFKIGATLGDFQCMKIYALILIDIGNEIDKKEGFRYLRLTADDECFEKMNFFTKMVSESCIFPDQLGEQIQQIKIQIENDRIDSMYRCGMMLYEGDGIECNKVEAVKYFKMAADKNHVLSMNRYATMLYEGDGIECNKVEAAKFFKISADAGSVNSMYRYSLMLKNGDGIPVNNDEYFKYVKMLHEKESENNFHMAHHLRKDAKIVFTGKRDDKDEKISVHCPQNIIGRNKPSQNQKPKNVIYNNMSLQKLFSLFFIIASIIALLQFLLETE